jgi:hypothetical protein
MKKLKRTLLVVVLLLPLLFSVHQSVSAQPTSQLFLVERIVTHPGMSSTLTGVWGEITQFAAEKGFTHGWSTYASLEDEIFIFFPLDKQGDLLDFEKEFMILMGEYGMENFQKSQDAIQSYDKFFMRRNSDLSYTPQDPRPMSELNIGIWDFNYFNSSDYPAVMELAGKYKSIMTEKAVSSRMHFYFPESGTDLPYVMSVVFGSDIADAFNMNVQMNKELGEAGPVLYEETQKLIRKREVSIVQWIPSLTYFPVKEE